MKNKELFDKTVSILAKAYFDGTLVHGDFCGCAVGNLCAASIGDNVIKKHGEYTWNNGFSVWHGVFYTPSINKQIISKNYYKGEAKRQIDATGYSWQNLARIEYAFETAPKDGDWEFNGLLSVYDVLCDIHEIDRSEVASPELVFVKA